MNNTHWLIEATDTGNTFAVIKKGKDLAARIVKSIFEEFTFPEVEVLDDIELELDKMGVIYVYNFKVKVDEADIMSFTLRPTWEY